MAASMIRIFAEALLRRGRGRKLAPVREAEPEWRKAADGAGGLVFHTAFAEFRGATARDIVDAMFENSRAGIPGLSYDQWWAHQQRVHAEWGVAIPASVETEDECRRFLDAMLATKLVSGGRKSAGPG